MQKKELVMDLKKLIVVECDKEDEVAWEAIEDEESLLGPEARLALDSLDALQIAVAVGERYGVRIAGANARKALVSTLACCAATLLALSTTEILPLYRKPGPVLAIMRIACGELPRAGPGLRLFEIPKKMLSKAVRSREWR